MGGGGGGGPQLPSQSLECVLRAWGANVHVKFIFTIRIFILILYHFDFLSFMGLARVQYLY